jgi:hypothetical protein
VPVEGGAIWHGSNPCLFGLNSPSRLPTRRRRRVWIGPNPSLFGFSGPPRLCGPSDAAAIAAYVAKPSGDPSHRPPGSPSSPVEPDEVASIGAGRLVPGTQESPEPTSSPALRLPARWVVARLPPENVLRSPAYTDELFLSPRVEMNVPNCARTAGERVTVDRA